MRTGRRIFLILSVWLGLTGMAGESLAGNYWDWMDMSAEQEAFCETYMPPFLEIRKQLGDEAALKELDRLFFLSAERFGSESFFYRIVWYEAQVHSGKEEEAWGLTLFQYLWKRRLHADPDLIQYLSSSEYLLLDNIIEYCYSLGMGALASSYVMIIEDNLERNLGFDMSRTSYKEVGTLFSFLPEARKRDYPIFNHTLDNFDIDENESLRDFIYYPNIYGIRTVAKNAKKSGDWITAAELSDWMIQYCDEYMIDQSNMKEEICDETGYAGRKTLSEIALLHGYPDESARFLEDFIERAEGYYHTVPQDLLKAKLELAVIQIITGELTEEALEMANRAVEASERDIYPSRTETLTAHLNRARVYHALGYCERAWEMVDELLDQTSRDVNPYHWVFMLNTAIDLALADGAQRPELESWLILALDNARKTGNKFDELPLYEKYACFLAMKGRLAEAVYVQQEAVRLAEAMALSKRLEDNLAVLKNLIVQLPQEVANNAPQESESMADTTPPNADNATSEPNQPKIATLGNGGEAITVFQMKTVDIQPRTSVSAALPGQEAYGRFYLTNPSTTLVAGRMQLHGPLADGTWLDDHWMTISASPSFAESVVEHDILMPAGGTYVIDITGLPSEDGTGTEIRCIWTPTGRTNGKVTASWIFEANQTGKRTAVIDAHELNDNPYYLIPIRHMIQRRDNQRRQSVDFSIEASALTRIEAYDARTGRLLAIDADGDGDFLGRGDLVAVDSNRNNLPDVEFEKGQSNASIILYVKPDDGNTHTELSIRLLENGTWRTDAIDTIKGR